MPPLRSSGNCLASLRPDRSAAGRWHRLAWVLGFTTAGSSSACSSAGSPDTDTIRTDDGSSADPSSPTNTGTGSVSDGSDLPRDEPFALASVNLWISKDTGDLEHTLIAAALFSPHVDPSETAACWQELGDCRLERVPQCDTCGDDEYCGFDASCEATCLRLCELSCNADEDCLFTSNGAPECVPRETFDAGKLTITGGSTDLVLDPPYDATDSGGEPWFESGATLTVSAEGTDGVGFSAFNHEFQATTLLDTTLAELGPDVIFSSDDIEFGWAPGNDSFVLSVTLFDADGDSASLSCAADDAAGRFVLPRATLEQVLDGASVSTVTVQLARARLAAYGGLTTQGKLDHSPVESEGWLSLSTGTSERRTYRR